MSTKVVKNKQFVSDVFLVTCAKILGIVYVIPFYAIVGERGGALYAYAYSIYSLFVSLSIVGIPFAISNIVSEYQTLGYYNIKKRVFLIGKKMALLLGFLCFLILIIFAPTFARFILDDLVGGNSIDDITLVIRMISISILIVPVLSVYRGYFEGHRLIKVSSFSQAVEQIIRLVFIVFSGYLSIMIFKCSFVGSVSITLLGFIIGGFVSYIYLLEKKVKNRRKFDEKIRKVNEPIITDRVIFKKIIIYAVPFILIDVCRSIYNYVDVVTVVRGLVSFANFSVVDAESIMGMLSIWGSIFNTIILVICLSVVSGLIPNLTQSILKKDKKDINNKINQALSILLFLIVPIAIGISFLSEPIWNLFYGFSKYGPNILSYFIFVGLILGLFVCVISIIQAFKDYKTIFISLIVGVIIKISLNTSLINTFYKLGLPAYYGVITASIVAYLISFIVCLSVLHFKYRVDYEQTVKHLLDSLCGCMLMIVFLFLIRFIVPIVSSSRLVNLLIIIFYVIIGLFVYLIFMSKIGAINSIFGDRIKKLFNKK